MEKSTLKRTELNETEPLSLCRNDLSGRAPRIPSLFRHIPGKAPPFGDAFYGTPDGIPRLRAGLGAALERPRRSIHSRAPRIPSLFRHIPEKAPLSGTPFLVRRTGFEPTTFGSGGQHSIQLSYRRILFLPEQLGYYSAGKPKRQEKFSPAVDPRRGALFYSPRYRIWSSVNVSMVTSSVSSFLRAMTSSISCGT